MLIIQHASEELGFETLREAVLSLRPDDKIIVLAIIQQSSSTTVQSRKLQDTNSLICRKQMFIRNKIIYRKACEHSYKVADIEKMRDIKKAIKQTQDKYSNCAEIEGIQILAEAQQVIHHNLQLMQFYWLQCFTFNIELFHLKS